MKSHWLSLVLLLAATASLPGCTEEVKPEDTGDTAEPLVELCANGADDDLDGAADCDDTDCLEHPACVSAPIEDCTDGVDNDDDTAVDCDDSDCTGDAACTLPASEDDCTDGSDNDSDGFIDCDDGDCASDAACAPPVVESLCDDDLDDDADTLVDCDDPDCERDPACAAEVVETVCDDGLDDDEDSLVDCEDVDCAAFPDCIEAGVEVRCEDGLDDDGDTFVDCDDDDCDRDAACYVPGVCGDEDLGSALGLSLATGTTEGAYDDFTPVTCATSSTAEDVSFLWTAPADGTYVLTTDGSDFDTVLTMWGSDCATESACDDDGGEGTQSLVTFTAVSGETVVFAVDGYSTYSGTYVVNLYLGTEADCRDGLDDDYDDLADCADSDCVADASCSPEGVCDDGIDEDVDDLTDCDDTDCAEDLACTHPCVDDELGGVVGASIAAGTTVGGVDDDTPSCATGAGAEDVAWLWTAPADAVYTFDTEGSSFDTTLVVELGDCSGTELECNDDDGGSSTSSVSVALLSGDEVAVYVDGNDDGAAGDYVLNVWTDTEVDCRDGGDEDLDGAADCDDTECAGSIVCVPEAVCDDGVDDDIDGGADCLDEDCAADSVCDTSIANYDLGTATGSGVASGTTVGGVDDSLPACSTSSLAEDISYAWVAPSSGDWTFDLTGSSYDTVLHILGDDGGAIACDDDSGEGTASLIILPMYAGDLVVLVVDGYSSGSGDYTLAIY